MPAEHRRRVRGQTLLPLTSSCSAGWLRGEIWSHEANSYKQAVTVDSERGAYCTSDTHILYFPAFQCFLLRGWGWHCKKKNANQELDVLRDLNSCLLCKYIYLFVLQERKRISWWRSLVLVTRKYNWAEFLPRTCSSRASNNLLRSLAYVPSITPWFSLVLRLWDCPPAIPSDCDAFHKTHLFTVNSNWVYWEKLNTYTWLQKSA